MDEISFGEVRADPLTPGPLLGLLGSGVGGMHAFVMAAAARIVRGRRPAGIAAVRRRARDHALALRMAALLSLDGLGHGYTSSIGSSVLFRIPSQNGKQIACRRLLVLVGREPRRRSGCRYAVVVRARELSAGY
jgi:hypothetical protein